VGVLIAPGRDCFRVREEELISPDEGVVVDSLISLGRSTADFVVALFLVAPSFPPLSDSVPLFPFFPFTLASPLAVLILGGSCSALTIDSFRLGTPVGGPPGPGSGPT
jgi:hypothetical protein